MLDMLHINCVTQENHLTPPELQFSELLKKQLSVQDAIKTKDGNMEGRQPLFPK